MCFAFRMYLLLLVLAWVPPVRAGETTQPGPAQPLTARSEPESKKRIASLPTRRPIMADPDRVRLGPPGPFPESVQASPPTDPRSGDSSPASNNGRSPDAVPSSEETNPVPANSSALPLRSDGDSVAPASNAASPSPRQRPEAPPDVRANDRQTGWVNRLESTGRRPIRIMKTGTGAERILVLGSIHGNEPASIAMLDALARRLEAITIPPEVTLMLVRTPNPDGLADRIQTNQRGVDLNRNFPSTWFTAAPTRETGPYPASEVETQQLLRLFREFDPQRVIHVRSGILQRPGVVLNRHWGSSSTAVRKLADVRRHEGGFAAGSLEEFVSLRLRAELATVWLPEERLRVWNADDLLTLAWDGIAVEHQEVDGAAEKEPQPPAGQTKQDRPPADGKRGYVEFLPPPPGHGADASSSRYYELPPPPF